jgi:hypothetical protein
MIAESERLPACDEAPDTTGNNVGVGFTVFVEGDHLVELNNDSIEVTVVGDADRPDHEVEGIVGRTSGVHRDEVESIGKWYVAIGKVSEQFSHVVRDRRDLLLLTLQCHDCTVAAYLDEKDALAGSTECGRREPIGCIEVAVDGHDGRRSASEPPVELTVRTIGEPVP